MNNGGNRFPGRELAALAVGLGVVVAMAFVTTRVRPIPVPFNFTVSLVLGVMAWFAILIMLTPPPPGTPNPIELIEQEFRETLQAIQTVAAQIARTGCSQALGDATSARLASIASRADSIVRRYDSRARDLAGATQTLRMLRLFDSCLAYYLNIRRGELVVDGSNDWTRRIEEFIPRFEMALHNIIKQLDAGEELNLRVMINSLEDMMRSLNLIETLERELESFYTEGIDPEEVGDGPEQGNGEAHPESASEPDRE